MKICSRCKRRLDESMFNINRATKDGLTSCCKDCQKEYNEARKLRYKDSKINLTHKICPDCKRDLNIDRFAINNYNKDGHNIRCKDCQNKIERELLKHRDVKVDLTHKICNKCGRDLDINMFNRNKNSRDNHSSWCKDCQREYDKHYYQSTLDSRHRIKLENNRKFYNKTKNDINFKLNRAISNGIQYSIKENKAGCHWEDLVDYNLQQLKEHLESQFDENMSWQNYGSYWEIDHIVPKNLFDIKDFKVCWSLVNLRPLSKIKNRKRPKDGSDINKELKQQIKEKALGL